jgi:tRNA-specific 2-thiouridylase
MGIPFYLFDASADFRQQVVTPFIRSYEQGLTPNPCILCNRHLKFSWLLDEAVSLGCDYIVTGHYARIRKDPATGRYLLYTAPDTAKDQSYFLAGLNQHQLSHTLFPLGELTKQQVRQIAEDQGFLTARKKDSQDICFIPDGDYKAFMERYTGKVYPQGDFLDLSGKIVGKHNGAVGYTLGQRKGLGLAMGCPVYVCGKDMTANTVTVGAEEHLFCSTLWADNCNFIPFDTLNGPIQVTAKARSRHTPQPATVYPEDNGRIRVEFQEPQRAITPGQAVVLYDGNLVIGSGTIL